MTENNILFLSKSLLESIIEVDILVCKIIFHLIKNQKKSDKGKNHSQHSRSIDIIILLKKSHFREHS
jgi:hypothetical protein